jgi:hypothetical protein
VASDAHRLLVVDDARHRYADACKLGMRASRKPDEPRHRCGQQVCDIIRRAARHRDPDGGERARRQVGRDAFHCIGHELEADRQPVPVIDLHGDGTTTGEAGNRLSLGDDAFLHEITDDEGDGCRTELRDCCQLGTAFGPFLPEQVQEGSQLTSTLFNENKKRTNGKMSIHDPFRAEDAAGRCPSNQNCKVERQYTIRHRAIGHFHRSR